MLTNEKHLFQGSCRGSAILEFDYSFVQVENGKMSENSGNSFKFEQHLILIMYFPTDRHY